VAREAEAVVVATAAGVRMEKMVWMRRPRLPELVEPMVAMEAMEAMEATVAMPVIQQILKSTSNRTISICFPSLEMCETTLLRADPVEREVFRALEAMVAKVGNQLYPSNVIFMLWLRCFQCIISGGCSYTVTEYDSDNRARTRTNAGGQDGASGTPGSNGEDGKPGCPGMAGTLSIFVVNTDGNVERYAGVYNFAVASLGALSSESGVIEPGQVLDVAKLNIKNIGYIRSPPTLEVHMIANTFIQPTDYWVINESIRPQFQFEHPESRKIKIASGLVAADPSQPLQVNTFLEFYGLLPRTNKAYMNLYTPVPITIRYPVELAIVRHGTVCVPGEMIPFAITIRNISRIGLGIGARNPRVLTVTIESVDPELADFLYVRKAVDNGGASAELLPTKYSLQSVVTFNVSYLAPESELSITGAIGVDASNTDFYDHAFLKVSLNLGTIDQPLQPLSIQQEESYFQIGEYFHPPVSTDFNAAGELSDDTKTCLLVVNCFTDRHEISYWRQLFAKTGLNLCLYNVSVHRGLSYFDEKFNLYKHFKFNCIVVLNSYVATETIEYASVENGELLFALQFLRVHEIFDAARYHGIRTFVVNDARTVAAGEKTAYSEMLHRYMKPLSSFPTTEADKKASTFDGRKKLYEYLKEKDVGPRDELLVRKNIYCTIKLFRLMSTPTANDYQQRIVELAEKLEEIRPDRQYFLYVCKFAISNDSSRC
jgi:hypothetical protein